MKLFPYLFSLFSFLFFFSCGEEHHEGSHATHVHVAPHGGQLVELGEHGSGFNLELVLHEDGFLQIYVLDAHVDNFVRISAGSIDIKITDSNGTEKTYPVNLWLTPLPVKRLEVPLFLPPRNESVTSFLSRELSKISR